MPNMGGVEATRLIMQESPCAILVVTVSVAAHFNLVFEAMSHGGLDAVNTPTLVGGEVRDGEPLLARLARIEKGRTAAVRPTPTTLPTLPPVQGRPSFLALGASTGGPEALARVLEALPRASPPRSSWCSTSPPSSPATSWPGYRGAVRCACSLPTRARSCRAA